MFKFLTSELKLLICMRWTRKKSFFYYLTTFYRFVRVFKYNRKFPFLKNSNICPKKIFLSKVNNTSFREFYRLLKSKNRKKNFKPFGSYIDFGKVLKKTEKSKYLRKYWVSWPKIRLDRKRIKSFTIKKKVIAPFKIHFLGRGQRR